MDDNFGTFPNWEEYDHNRLHRKTKTAFWKDVQDWKQRVEKELREKQKDWRPAYISIKEILGEN